LTPVPPKYSSPFVQPIWIQLQPNTPALSTPVHYKYSSPLDASDIQIFQTSSIQIFQPTWIHLHPNIPAH
jgi:hypothetical protein